MGIKVFLADDHRLLVAGFRDVLKDYGIDVVEVAYSLDGLIDRFLEVKPDVLVIDVRFDSKGCGENGLDVCEELLARDPSAKIIVNARTGSIVMNQAVTIGPCAVAHGNLSVTISSTPVVSQPNAFSQGQTVVTEKADIQINQEPGNIIQMPAGSKLTDVVKALNTLGANPQDLLAILQAMKAAGALQAELEVI